MATINLGRVRGRDGLPGRDGERGPIGLQGPVGPQGIQGETGPSVPISDSVTSADSGVAASSKAVKLTYDAVSALANATVPAGVGANKFLGVDTAGTVAEWRELASLLADGSITFTSEQSTFYAGIPGMLFPFSGTLGGTGNKHPLDPRTGKANTAYAICDGSTYTSPDGREVKTPDLRDRFIIGSGTSHASGSTGGGVTKTTTDAGAHAHVGATSGYTTLTIAQMPAHGHTIAAYRNMGSSGGSLRTDGDNSLNSKSTDATGGGGAHAHSIPATNTTGSHNHTVNVEPPYYALTYIMQL